MIHVNLWCRVQAHDDIRSIPCICRIFTCIHFLPLRQATIMAPTVDRPQCKGAGCQARASKNIYRRLDGTGETFYYCSVKHKQEDRKRCEWWDRDARPKHADAPQDMDTVAPMNSNSAASGQPPTSPATVGNDVAYIPASRCYNLHCYGVSEQKRR